jgi:quercetin dioxygenase-like cupin family protein
MPGAVIVRLGETVNYQDGAVVSRTLVKGATGTITVFAFDAGQALSEHTAAFDALLQPLEGEAEITISGNPFPLQAGEAILLPAHQRHGVTATTRFKMLLTMIRS